MVLLSKLEIMLSYSHVFLLKDYIFKCNFVHVTMGKSYYFYLWSLAILYWFAYRVRFLHKNPARLGIWSYFRKIQDDCAPSELWKLQKCQQKNGFRTFAATIVAYVFILLKLEFGDISITFKMAASHKSVCGTRTNWFRGICNHNFLISFANVA